MRYLYTISFGIILQLGCLSTAQAQQKATTDSTSFFSTVKTYVNPVLPGDHPDPTLLKVGRDFYYCGSTFHFNPYLPIYHSTDLVHWEVISRVLPSAKAGWVNDRPSGGIWQGAITYFYGSYWIYFSAGGQWFCKASSPAGPWTDPVRVKSNQETGNLGYDNSIFVDDDGKPYMIIKDGQKVNRIQPLGPDGQITGNIINMDWVNAKLQYSWAEGPVMCKRNGFYYYFPAGDVSGGQYVMRGTALTGDSTKWERLGDFFKPITDAKAGFRRPNHIAAPFQLADGSWWTIGQSYEKYEGNDWSGLGRQTSLYPIIWEGDRPWGMAPTTQPILMPLLPKSTIPWRSVKTDYFNATSLGTWWHFLTKKASNRYSLTLRKGWVRLTPDSNRTHLMQKETDHFYSVVTKVSLRAIEPNAKAGLYLTNGNQKEIARLYTGYDNGKKIIFTLDTATRIVANLAGDVVWLKLQREQHLLTAFYSGDGKKWTQLGRAISAVKLDMAQPNFNSWVGTSVGLFAEGKPADFDFFICKDGLSPLPAAGYSNYFGVMAVDSKSGVVVTNTSALGGWFMISGVELGATPPSALELTVSSAKAGYFEVWLDDLKSGKLIAKIPFTTTGAGNWKMFKKGLSNVTGQHDLFIKFPPGTPNETFVKSIKFITR
jgi:xylan 1,4-beta-xylosidase